MSTNHLRSFNELPFRRLRPGVAVRSVAGERATLGIVELEPNAVVSQHQHENEQLGLVVAGSVRVRLGDEERKLSLGDTYRMPADSLHEIVAGDEGAVVIDVFVPRRDDWEALPPDQPRDPMWPA